MYLSTKSIEKCFKKCADLAANFELHGVEPGLLLAELELQLLLQRRCHALLLPVPFVHLAGTSRAAAFCSKKKSGKKNRMTCSFQIGVSNTEVLINAAHLRFNMRPLSKQKSCFQHQSCFLVVRSSGQAVLVFSEFPFKFEWQKKEEGKLEFFRCKKKEQKPQALPFLSRIGSNKIQESDSFLT